MTRNEIRKAALQAHPSAERVRIRAGAVEVYGPMPNTAREGWYFLAWEQDVEIKGEGALR